MSELTERIIPFSFREDTNNKPGYLILQIKGHCHCWNTQAIHKQSS